MRKMNVQLKGLHPFIFEAKDTEHTNAVALSRYLQQLRPLFPGQPGFDVVKDRVEYGHID